MIASPLDNSASLSKERSDKELLTNSSIAVSIYMARARPRVVWQRSLPLLVHC